MKSYAMTLNQGYCKLEGNLVQIEKGLLGQQIICRINRTTLVNITRVTGSLLVSNMKVAVDMEDGSKHIVSRRYQKDFMERIKEYYGKTF